MRRSNESVQRATEGRLRIFLLPLLAALMLLALPGVSPAAIAVFVDGRILKVEDAYLDGGHIVLLLGDEAWMRVPATRIDRVVADEVLVDTEEHLAEAESCDPAWSDQPLPATTLFREQIRQAARDANLHPLLLASLVRAESAFDPRAVSRAGACGLTQLMPAAALQHGVEDVWDPGENLRGGATHLRLLLDRFETLPLALAAYNAGAATVQRTGGIPPYRETQEFVRRVVGWFCADAADTKEAPAAGAPAAGVPAAGVPAAGVPVPSEAVGR